MIVSFPSFAFEYRFSLPPVNLSLRYVFATPTLVGFVSSHTKFRLTIELFGPSLHIHCRYFYATTTLADFSPFVVTTKSLMRPRGISHQSFFVYLPNLLAQVTVAFWTLRLIARSSVMQALILGFCSSGYDFAIASSRPHLTM